MDRMSPNELLERLFPATSNTISTQNRRVLGTTITETGQLPDFEAALSLSGAIEVLHGKIWPGDRCEVKFSTEEIAGVVKVTDLGPSLAEYTIYYLGFAAKIGEIQAEKLFYFDPLCDLPYGMPKDMIQPDRETAIFMIAAAALRGCYLERNSYTTIDGASENIDKIDDPRLKSVAEYVIKIKNRAKFDQVLIAYWIGTLCLMQEGISIDDIVRVITLSPADVGIR